MDLGILAGMGDWAERKNELAHQADIEQRHGALAARKDFADQLLKIGMDESWPNAARGTALQHRVAVLNNPKLSDKDFDRMWGDVWRSSKRTVSGAAERNAQRTSVPALRDASAAASGPSPIPGFDSVSSQLSQFFGDQAGQREQALSSFGGMTPESTEAFGPKTAGEHAQDAMSMLQLLNQGPVAAPTASSTAPSAPSNRYQVTGFDAKGHPKIGPVNDRFRYQGGYMADLGEAGGLVPVTFDRTTSSYKTADGRVVQPKDIFHADRAQFIETTDENGNPVRVAVPVLKSMSDGSEKPAPVRLDQVRVTQNGRVYIFNRNPFSGKLSPRPIAAGTTPNRDIAEAGIGIRQQSNARQQASFDFDYGAEATDVDGTITGTPGTKFIPAGLPTDAKGNPIPPKTYKLTRPPAAIVTRAHVAQDALNQAKSVLDHLEKVNMRGDFGPLRGRTLGWLVQKGLIADSDIKALQLQLASLESMNPAVHQMRNFAIAKDIASRLGELGQPYENFVAGVKTLQSFYDEVSRSGVTPVVPTTSKKILSPRPAPSQNMQILNQLQQLLGTPAAPTVPPPKIQPPK